MNDQMPTRLVTLRRPIVISAKLFIYGVAEGFEVINVSAFDGTTDDDRRWTILQLRSASYVNDSGYNCGFSRNLIRLETPVTVTIDQRVIASVQESP